ncbi:hypothetical protein M4I21_12820 [Cellulophaga sp. 20_2_10]|uniref:hypothetical protein n=1 Tax=Cellulophaga sp. 20_2_10 TaxID=2942476 RepID=UPI00201B25AC|nr:hypothetical protein [Cellulophaga sp. 20_2_10]MCL5246700.1 hypothetical protein [Cellulophaga sp. 20_2_10]
MKQLLIVILIIIFYSCSFNNKKTTTKREIVYDTIKVTHTEIVYDTIIIAERVIDSTKVVRILNVNSKNKPDGIPQDYFESDSFIRLKSNFNYEIDSKLNTASLEDDFNGDGYLDIIYSIQHIETKKKGWLVIHGNTKEAFILAVGKGIKNRGIICVDNSVESWNINKEKINEPGLEEYSGQGKNGELILETSSIFLRTACGCGLIYWDGEEYAYFNQCA